MARALSTAIIVTLLVLAPQALFAFDFQKYTQHLQSLNADTPTKSTLLAIMGSCGYLANLDDACVIDSLNRAFVEEDNTLAAQIIVNYESALNEGQYDTPECQNESHMQVNRIIGHCILLMNYYALESENKDTAISHFETCLQGGMLGLAYQSNLAAQYMVVDIFREKGHFETAKQWQMTLNAQRDSENFSLLRKCYG